MLLNIAVDFQLSVYKLRGLVRDYDEVFFYS